MHDAGMYKRISIEEYEAFFKKHRLTDLELAVQYYIYRGIPEFEEAFKKEYKSRNGRSFDDMSERRILDFIKDDYIANAILPNKDIDKAYELRDEYDRLGIA